MLPSAGGIIVGPKGKLALVNQHGNSWSFPKGHVKEGESLLEAAKREIYEETGLVSEELEYCDELGSYERYSIAAGGVGEDFAMGSRQRIFFLFKTTQTTVTPHDTGEISQVRWVTIDEALSLLTHPKDVEFLQSIRQKIEEAI